MQELDQVLRPRVDITSNGVTRFDVETGKYLPANVQELTLPTIGKLSVSASEPVLRKPAKDAVAAAKYVHRQNDVHLMQIQSLNELHERHSRSKASRAHAEQA